LVARVVAHNYLAFQLVDDEDFRALLASLNPFYKPPSRGKLTNTLLPAFRDKLEAVIRKKLEMISSASLSFDSWTSTANRSYIAVTCHGITKAWTVETFMLSILPVAQDETGVFLAQMLEEVLEQWGIRKEQIVAITSDGAANAKNAVMSQLDITWVCCFSHVIN